MRGVDMIPKRKHRALKFKVGDRARLRKDALLQHSRSVPAHAGYTREGFAWRATLKKYEGKIGKITMIFDSGSVNLTYRDKNTIGIDQSQLVKL